MMDRMRPNVTAHCQLWYSDDHDPAFSRVAEFSYMWYPQWGNAREGILQPYLLSCPAPTLKSRIPR